MGALAISALLTSSFSGLITAIIWHFLRRHWFFCDKTEEPTRQDKVRVCDNVELIARDAAAIRNNLTEKMDQLILDLRVIKGNMDRNWDREIKGLEYPHPDLGIPGMRKARYVEYSSGHLPPLLRRENY